MSDEAVPRVKGLCWALLVTWGFSLVAYGRLQRVSGFEERALCEGVRVRIERAFPRAVIAPVCTVDQ